MLMGIYSLRDALGNQMSVHFVLLITALECSPISILFIVHIFRLYLTNLGIGTLRASVKGLAKLAVNIFQCHLHRLSPLSTEGNHFMIETAA